MSENADIEALLTEVTDESEAHRHDSLPEDAVGRRRDAGPAPRVLSVRLTDAQYRRLAAIASDRDLPVSTLARLAILEYLDQAAQPASGPIDLTAVTAALREVLRPEFLKAG